MYAYIEGAIAARAQNELVVDVGGVGYLLSCSAATLAAAPQTGERMRVFTWLSVREDALELFGFATVEEREMFHSLRGVSGIGPKTALAILGSMPLRDLSIAIVMGDTTALARAPGIGKKTAQRIALELKEKISQDDIAYPGDVAPLSAPGMDAEREAMQALQQLGYSAQEAARAVSRVRGQADTADGLLKLALRGLG